MADHQTLLMVEKRPRTLETSSLVRIQRWQETAVCDPDRPDTGIVSSTVAVCLRFIGFLAQHTPATFITKAQRLSLQRRHNTLKLWALGYGALDGRLESALDRSEDLKQVVLEVLEPMCEALARGLDSIPMLSGVIRESEDLCKSARDSCSRIRHLLTLANYSASDSDSESDFDGTQDPAPVFGVEGLVEDIKTYTQCLADLGPTLSTPAITDEPGTTIDVPAQGERNPNEYHAGLLSNKYPRANALLVECLGKTSWARFLRMQYERELNISEHIILQEPAVVGASKSLVSNSEFQDSGLGTSLPVVPSAYAESTVSFMTSITGGERVRIPPLPAEAKQGLPFECTACGRSVRAMNNREWRKHLYADLRPYTCFYATCSFNQQPFSTRQLWSDHLELGHNLGPAWQPVQCPLCLEVTGEGKSTILTHFARHMEEISLVALPPTVESDDESDSSSVTAGSLNSNSDCGNIVEATNPTSRKSTLASVQSSTAHREQNGATLCRAKLWELKGNDWEDQGTGSCHCDSTDGRTCLTLLSEDEPGKKLLEVYPTEYHGFQKQQDTLVVWTRQDGTDLALSFQDPKDCADIWITLQDVGTFSETSDLSEEWEEGFKLLSKRVRKGKDDEKQGGISAGDHLVCD